MTPLEAMQSTLAGEHAAVYLYGLVGGRVSVAGSPELWQRVGAAYAVHRGRRDQLVAMVRAADGDPVPSAVSYQPATPARTERHLREEARLLEDRCAAVYADMVGATAGAGRRWALDALEDAAVRALGFGSQPEPFPGVAEL